MTGINCGILLLLCTLLTCGNGDDIRKVTSLDQINTASYRDGAPCFILYTIPESAPNKDQYAGFIEKLQKDRSNGHDLFQMVQGKEPRLTFVNAKRRIDYLGPLDLNIFLATARHFDNGEMMAVFSDANFEHDTQASSGGTTGSWLVVFDDMADYDDSNYYEAISLLMRSYYVNFGVAQSQFCFKTYKRFNQIFPDKPSAIFLHRKELFVYPGRLEAYNMVDALVKFVKSDYQEQVGRPIPRQIMIFDDIVDVFVNLFRDYEDKHGYKRAMVVLCSIAFTSICVFALILYLTVNYFRKLPEEMKSKTE